MSFEQVPYARHLIQDDDETAVISALKSENLTTGPLVAEFERLLQEFCGAETTVVTSGTAALHSIFSVLNLQPKDEIITPPNTFVATQATAAITGAEIKFAEIQSDTGNIDPESVKSLISPKTKVIVAVDFAGHPAELDELNVIAKYAGAKLIEDAAHSLGSTYRGTRVGSQADATAFSFFATKNIATGEGGAISTKHTDLASRVRTFSRQGIVREDKHFKNENLGPWYYEVQNFGLNYRLPDILCALGVSQLKKIQSFKEFRSFLFQKYTEFLSQYKFITLPTVRSYVEPMWHLYPIRVPKEIRKDIYLALHREGIKVQVNYIPSYWHPAFDPQIYPKGLCPIAEDFYSGEISMPMYVEEFLLSDEYFDRLDSVFSKYA